MRTEVVGGANIQVHQDKKSEYIAYQCKDSVKFWHVEWFYLANPRPALLKHTGWPP